MKISAEQLRLIIVEELRSVLSEGFEPYPWEISTFKAADSYKATYTFIAQKNPDSPRFEYKVIFYGSFGRYGTGAWDVAFYAEKLYRDGTANPMHDSVSATNQMDRRVMETISDILKHFALEHRPAIKFERFRKLERFYADAVHEAGEGEDQPSSRARMYLFLLKRAGIQARLSRGSNNRIEWIIPAPEES